MKRSTRLRTRGLAVDPKLGPDSFPALLEAKRLLVNRTGYIELHPYGDGSKRRRRTGRSLKTWLLEAPQACSRCGTR